jgi:hypothetical protein
MAGAGRFRRARCRLRWATLSQPGCRAGIHAGVAGGPRWRRTFNVAVQPWHWIVVGTGCGSAAWAHGPRGRPDRHDPDATRGRVRHSLAVELGRGTRPAEPAAVGQQGAVHAQPDWDRAACRRACRRPGPQPPALGGHDRGRQGSPSRCSCWAVRLRARLAGHPPTPPPQQGPRWPPPTASLAGRARRYQPDRGQPRRAQQVRRTGARSRRRRWVDPEHPAGSGSQ